MKKLSLSILILLSFTFTYAQTDSLSIVKIKSNEIKLNLFYSIIGKLEFPEISYERLIEDQISAGISIAGRNREYKIDYMITPYFRHYFPKKHKTFFFELSIAFLRSVENLGHDFYDPVNQGIKQERMANTAGIGGAFGLKFMFSKSFVMDTYFGLGKIIMENNGDSYQSMLVYPRIGIAMGPRF